MLNVIKRTATIATHYINIAAVHDRSVVIAGSGKGGRLLDASADTAVSVYGAMDNVILFGAICPAANIHIAIVNYRCSGTPGRGKGGCLLDAGPNTTIGIYGTVLDVVLVEALHK